MPSVCLVSNLLTRRVRIPLLHPQYYSLSGSMSVAPPLMSHGIDGKIPLIGTHDGTFHCDEALAVFLLRQTSTFRNSSGPLHFPWNIIHLTRCFACCVNAKIYYDRVTPLTLLNATLLLM